MVPVLFAYGGWQTANFLVAEMKEPKKNLPRGLLLGVLGVVVLYVAVNWVCLRSLGPQALAATSTPATAVMRLAQGRRGIWPGPNCTRLRGSTWRPAEFWTIR
jgi:APA family basic amino acid/polyamine antiporter